jgi:lipopolysaccharide transport system permease protein
VLTPSPTPLGHQLRELWCYRELLGFLVWRDVKVRYRQTVLGAAWVVFQPATITAVFSILFGRLGGLERHVAGGIPYPLFVYAGLLPWTVFSTGFGRAAGSLVGHGYLISRIWFPRLVLPLSAIVVGLVDFAVATSLLAGFMAFYGVAPRLTVLLAPLFVALSLVTALGLGLLLGALTVHLRDLRNTLPFFTWVLLFATPLAYPSSLLSPEARTVYGLNPLVGAVDGFRWALYGAPLHGPALALSVAVSLILLGGGLWLYSRVERNAADLV